VFSLYCSYTGRAITRVAPASPPTMRNTSVEDDSVLQVSVNESGSGSKSPLKQSSGHVRSQYSKSSGSRPTSTETSRQISSRPLSRSSGDLVINLYSKCEEIYWVHIIVCVQ